MNSNDQNLEWRLCESYFSILETNVQSEVSLDTLCKVSKISIEKVKNLVPNDSINQRIFFLKILISKLDREVLSELETDIKDDTVSSSYDKLLEGLSLRFDKYLQYKQSLKNLSKNSKQKFEIFLNVFKENQIFSSDLLTLIEKEQNCGIKILKSVALNIVFTKGLEIFLKDENQNIDAVIRNLDKNLSDMKDVGLFMGIIKK